MKSVRLSKRTRSAHFPGAIDPKLVVHMEAGCGVDGRHLQSDKRVDSFLDGAAQDMVDMSGACEGVRVGIVGNQAAKARIQPGFLDGMREPGQVAPCGALAELGIHAKTNFSERIFGAG